MMKMELGGVGYFLDPSAISAIRYRAEYGESIVNHLAGKSIDEAEGPLLRMCHMMIPVADRPELADFAKIANQDGDFLSKAIAARDALLFPDPKAPAGGEGEGEPFDEYTVLALMAAAGVGTELIYELPILHLASVVSRYYEMQDPERKDYRPATQEERTALYPRRKTR